MFWLQPIEFLLGRALRRLERLSALVERGRGACSCAAPSGSALDAVALRSAEPGPASAAACRALSRAPAPASTSVLICALAAAQAVQVPRIRCVSTTATTAAGTFWASGRGRRERGGGKERELDLGHQNWVPTLNVNNLVSSPGCLSNGLGKVEAERAERRIPVEADADRNARLGRPAIIEFAEAPADRPRCRDEPAGTSRPPVATSASGSLRVPVLHCRRPSMPRTPVGPEWQDRWEGSSARTGAAQSEHRTGIDEHRRTDTQFTDAGAERNFEFEMRRHNKPGRRAHRR